jgi:hypothetical protein
MQWKEAGIFHEKRDVKTKELHMKRSIFRTRSENTPDHIDFESLLGHSTTQVPILVFCCQLYHATSVYQPIKTQWKLFILHALTFINAVF